MDPAESPEPLTPEDFAALRAHPRFRETVRQHVAANLAHYAGLQVIERWMTSDLGRTSLAAASVVLSISPAGLTQAGLVASAVYTRASSRGRVRLFLERAIANGLVLCDGPLQPDTPLTLTDRFVRIISQVVDVGVPAAARLAPEMAPVLARLQDIDFRRRMTAWMGMAAVSRLELFPGADAPIHLFQTRDGGSRMLEQLILRQPADGEHLLGDCDVSGLSLARASFCSRRHVSRLFADGAALGLMWHGGGRLKVSQALSEDVELYYARVYAACRTASLAALAG